MNRFLLSLALLLGLPFGLMGLSHDFAYCKGITKQDLENVEKIAAIQAEDYLTQGNESQTDLEQIKNRLNRELNAYYAKLGNNARSIYCVTLSLYLAKIEELEKERTKTIFYPYYIFATETTLAKMDSVSNFKERSKASELKKEIKALIPLLGNRFSLVKSAPADVRFRALERKNGKFILREYVETPRLVFSERFLDKELKGHSKAFRRFFLGKFLNMDLKPNGKLITNDEFAGLLHDGKGNFYFPSVTVPGFSKLSKQEQADLARQISALRNAEEQEKIQNYYTAISQADGFNLLDEKGNPRFSDAREYYFGNCHKNYVTCEFIRNRMEDFFSGKKCGQEGDFTYSIKAGSSLYWVTKTDSEKHRLDLGSFKNTIHVIQIHDQGKGFINFNCKGYGDITAYTDAEIQEKEVIEPPPITEKVNQPDQVTSDQQANDTNPSVARSEGSVTVPLHESQNQENAQIKHTPDGPLPPSQDNFNGANNIWSTDSNTAKPQDSLQNEAGHSLTRNEIEKWRLGTTDYLVTGTILNVRIGPGKDQDKIDTLTRGTELMYSEKQGKWGKFIYENDRGEVRSGWIFLNFVQKEE